SIATIHEGELPHGAAVTIGGIISGVDRRVNKNGEPWAIVTIEDFYGGVEVLFFPRTYRIAAMDIAEDAVVLVKARINIREDRVSVFGDTLEVPDLVVGGNGAPLALTLATRMCTIETVTALKRVIGRPPGRPGRLVGPAGGVADVPARLWWDTGSRDRHRFRHHPGRDHRRHRYRSPPYR